MTHPKARSKPRQRERRSAQDRILITPKGRAMLEALEQFVPTYPGADYRDAERIHEQARATPCAPNRGNDAPAPLPAHNAGTAGAPPAHPAGKSGAAPLAKEPNTDT